jgi:hypothetical protein
MAACARESDAIGVFSSERVRISSPKPGITFSQTRIVASGVTSLAAMPVPPVVTMSGVPAEAIAPAMASI